MRCVARLDYDRPFQKHLRPGETLLWVGRPVQGIVFRRTDWAIILFSLAWTAVAISWVTGALRYGINVLLNPCPNVVIVGVLGFGLYMLVGRFLDDARQRSRTWYALTDRRALILYVGKTVCFNAVEGPDCKTVTLQRHANGSATIIFESKEVDPYWVLREGRGGFLDETRPSSPAFEGIDTADEVYALLRANPAFADALKRATAPPPPKEVRPSWAALAFILVALSGALGVAAHSDSQSRLQAEIPQGRGAVVINPGAVNEQYCQTTSDGRPDRSEPITKEQYLAYARLHARSRNALKVAAFLGVMLVLWAKPFWKPPVMAAARKVWSQRQAVGRLRRPGTSS
jgi:hypothetical protein